MDLVKAASQPACSPGKHAAQIIDLMAKAGTAILVLLFITTKSICKPREKHANKRRDIKILIVFGVIVPAPLSLPIVHFFGVEMHRH